MLFKDSLSQKDRNFFVKSIYQCESLNSENICRQNQKNCNIYIYNNDATKVEIIYNFRHKNLAVVDLKQRKIIGGTTVPHSRANNPDFTQVTTGNLDWLDGFGLEHDKTMMAALTTVESSLHIVEWNLFS